MPSDVFIFVCARDLGWLLLGWRSRYTAELVGVGVGAVEKGNHQS